MATNLHNLSEYDPKSVPSAKGMRFGIVVSEWNHHITGPLLEGAQTTLLKHGVSEEDILVMTVPGSFELVFGAAQMAKSGKVDGATQGLAELNTTGDVPVIYGLLTCNNLQQAQDRAGGILGNKGDECAVTAIKMVDYKRRIKG